MIKHKILCLCILLIMNISVYADEDVHLSDAQKLEVLDDLEPDLLKSISGEYVTRGDVIDILYKMYYDEKPAYDMPEDERLYSDVTDGKLHYKMIMVNYIGESQFINGVGDRIFRPNSYCKLSEFIKFSFGLGGLQNSAKKIAEQNNCEIYPYGYMKYAEKAGLINVGENPDRYITRDEVRTILSKVIFEKITEPIYYCVRDHEEGDPILTRLYGLKMKCGTVKIISDEQFMVDDKRIDGTISNDLNDSKVLVLYYDGVTSNDLYKVFSKKARL